MRAGKEAWILLILLGFFVLATAVLTQRGEERQRRDQPTSYSVGRGGTRALYELLSRQGVAAERWERPWTRLRNTAALLVMFEPILTEEGDLREGEQAALWKWVESGGTFLLVVSRKGIGTGVGLDNIAVDVKTNRPADISPLKIDSPLLRDVQTLHVEGQLRLDNRDPAHQQTLAADTEGAYAVSSTRGKGRVVVVTDGLASTNEQLAKADNAIFFVNVAESSVKAGRAAVLFDEYHQGYGEEGVGGRSLWQAVGRPVRMAFYYLAAVSLVLIYSLNRRFGAPIDVSGPPSRPSTEYISSMAGFYKRAQAADIPFETIYHTFVRDLALRVEAPPDSTPDRLAELAGRRYGWSQAAVQQLLARSREVIENPGVSASRRAARGREMEVFQLAQQIQDFRRKAELDRLI